MASEVYRKKAKLEKRVQEIIDNQIHFLDVIDEFFIGFRCLVLKGQAFDKDFIEELMLSANILKSLKKTILNNYEKRNKGKNKLNEIEIIKKKFGTLSCGECETPVPEPSKYRILEQTETYIILECINCKDIVPLILEEKG